MKGGTNAYDPLILVISFTGISQFTSSMKPLLNSANPYEDPVYQIKIDFIGSVVPLRDVNDSTIMTHTLALLVSTEASDIGNVINIIEGGK